MDPSMIQTIIDRIKRCRNARITRETLCWNGGDPGHKKKISDENNAIRKCAKFLKKNVQ